MIWASWLQSCVSPARQYEALASGQTDQQAIASAPVLHVVSVCRPATCAMAQCSLRAIQVFIAAFITVASTTALFATV